MFDTWSVHLQRFPDCEGMDQKCRDTIHKASETLQRQVVAVDTVSDRRHASSSLYTRCDCLRRGDLQPLSTNSHGTRPVVHMTGLVHMAAVFNAIAPNHKAFHCHVRQWCHFVLLSYLLGCLPRTGSVRGHPLYWRELVADGR